MANMYLEAICFGHHAKDCSNSINNAVRQLLIN